jgi:hypothetical protein
MLNPNRRERWFKPTSIWIYCLRGIIETPAREAEDFVAQNEARLERRQGSRASPKRSCR